MPELVFKGKEYVYNHHLTVPYRPLVPDKSKSIGAADLSGNLIIHGDNLHALKSLLPRYAGKVDLIFIDPPYNTGNENWAYNDNVNSPIMKEWLRSNPVNAEDMLRHDKWLCMMWPRIVLLRELLSESGSLWMTLDDNEVHRARMLMDEIFGAENFVATCIWQKRFSPSNDELFLSTTHDYVIVYARDLQNWDRGLLPRTDEQIALYKNPDSDARGVWASDNYVSNKSREERPNSWYAIVRPSDGKEIWPSPSAVWRYSKEQHQRNVESGRVWWGEQGLNEVPRFKRFLSDVQTGVVPQTLWFHEEVGHNQGAKQALKEIFPEEVTTFQTPKPVELLDRILKIGARPDSIVLDSFAGSGTTAHGVLKANAKDGGNRKFILVEGEGYADSLTAERVRRVMNGYAFVGTRREQLLREKITWTKLQKAGALLQEVEVTKAREGFADGDLADQGTSKKKRFDKIAVKMDDGELLVEGEKKISERVEGLGGEFTYCTLGQALDAEKILSGETLPDYESLGAWLFHTATGGTLDTSRVDESLGYLGEANDRHVWLIYKPELSFLKSTNAALTLSFAQSLRHKKPGKPHLVFAAAKFMSNKQLLESGVEFASLPFGLYRES
jgi:adenine-specific DNA-methyltransferase